MRLHGLEAHSGFSRLDIALGIGRKAPPPRKLMYLACKGYIRPSPDSYLLCKGYLLLANGFILADIARTLQVIRGCTYPLQRR
ncbi:hypothetical protein BG22_03060 [Bifidobacterium sp. UTBIF-78]|nr:hypothetical protein BG22_03060 [Bifidobacterium sp. UTBIF-78]